MNTEKSPSHQSEKIITDSQYAVLNYLQELINEKLTELQIISAAKTDKADILTTNIETKNSLEDIASHLEEINQEIAELTIFQTKVLDILSFIDLVSINQINPNKRHLKRFQNECTSLYDLFKQFSDTLKIHDKKIKDNKESIANLTPKAQDFKSLAIKFVKIDNENKAKLALKKKKEVEEKIQELEMKNDEHQLILKEKRFDFLKTTRSQIEKIIKKAKVDDYISVKDDTFEQKEDMVLDSDREDFMQLEQLTIEEVENYEFDEDILAELEQIENELE